jgi:histone deacetylase 11
MLRATEGSILAALAALKLGWAVNLSGGFHHASYGNGGGFCIYPDISLIVHYLQSRTLIRRIMIVDLDAHQGNGFERDLIINENVYIVDCYNSKIYPQDPEGKDAIMRTILIQPSTSNLEYLQRIDSLEQDFQFCQPEFVIYNAGTDILTGDPLGKLSMSRETVIKRDERVIEMSRSRGVPVVMLLSGGYQSTSGEIIGESLENLCRKFG